jgi:hypothetical protein
MLSESKSWFVPECFGLGLTAFCAIISVFVPESPKWLFG